MTPKIDYSLLLPTFNEAENIGPLLERLRQAVPEHFSYEIVCIDDSTDETPRLIYQETLRDPRIRLIHRPQAERTGLATAFVRGFSEAQGEAILCMDTDLQHPPEVVPALFHTISATDADIIVASRYTKGGSAEGLNGPLRKVVSVASKYFVWLLLAPSRKTTDPGSGFFVFKKHVIEGVTLSPTGFKILLEILVKAQKVTCTDISYTFQKRKNDTSKATLKQGTAFLRHVYQLCMAHPEASRGIRYLIVGGSGVIVNISVLFVLVTLFSLSEYIAWFLAILISIASNYVLNNHFTFTDKKKSGIKANMVRYSTFTVLTLMTVYLNYLVYSYLLSLGVQYLLAAIGGIGVATVLNFLLSSYVVWSSRFRLKQILVAVIGLVAVWYFVLFVFSLPALSAALVLLSMLLSIQGLFSSFLMLYGWEDPATISKSRSPSKFQDPTHSFTALIPARHEENVIAQTIHTVARIDYPEALKEIVVICRHDDIGTIQVVERTIKELWGKHNIALLIFDGFPINKPHGLNIGLHHSRHDIVTIFDAEDQPHTDIYNIANTVFLNEQADVVQSGVQLMNHHSNWYSLFNVLEYFFWFKSSLHFFAKAGLIPLAGNTVFFKRQWLQKINGWDQTCLTEDADIGIRLSSAGAKTGVVYDERHVTQEETPPSLWSFVKQRTRWNQGFIQILFKKDWLRLPRLSEKMLAMYILLWPIVQGLLFLYLPFGVCIALYTKVPSLVAIIANIPLYVFLLNLVIYNVGLYEFTTSYGKKYHWQLPLKITMLFIPFQCVLGFSACRALVRQARQNISWEKTAHLNAHR